MKHNIKPLFDFLLIRPVEKETTTSSGIIIPDSAKEKPTVGEIMAIGDGGLNDEGKPVKMVVKIGQKVLYKKWGGNEVKVGSEEWMLIQQKDLMAIME